MASHALILQKSAWRPLPMIWGDAIGDGPRPVFAARRGAASSRVNTVIFSPSGFAWSSGTEWARSVRTAPGTRWVVANSGFSLRAARRQPHGQHNLQSYRPCQPAPRTADHPKQGGWPKTLFKQRSFDPAVDVTPLFLLRENAIAKEPGLRYPERWPCVSRLGCSNGGSASFEASP